LLTQYLEKHWIYVRQTSSTGAFWDKDERINFSEKVKVQSTVGANVLENALFGLVNVMS